ncbi:Uncharacterised protein [Raoultella ornithinolytica]|nr:Uncharacterised protein [Raoultella ornithinolytica]
MVKSLHRVLQPGGLNSTIRSGLLPGDHRIHSAVAENKQHPFAERLRGDLRDLCGDGVAQGVTFSLLTQRVGHRDDFFYQSPTDRYRPGY